MSKYNSNNLDNIDNWRSPAPENVIKDISKDNSYGSGGSNNPRGYRENRENSRNFGESRSQRSGDSYSRLGHDDYGMRRSEQYTSRPSSTNEEANNAISSYRSTQNSISNNRYSTRTDSSFFYARYRNSHNQSSSYSNLHSSYGQYDRSNDRSSDELVFDLTGDKELTDYTKEFSVKWREDNRVKLESDEAYPPILDFTRSFSQHPDIISIFERLKIESPTVIQSQSWPIIMKGNNFIGIAQTGSGKTLSFILPSYIHLKYNSHHKSSLIRILVLTPTRELAQQIYDEYNKFLPYEYRCCVFYGGEAKFRQLKSARAPFQVAICTPGRLIDLLQLNLLNLETVSYFVIDEADRMLDMGFLPQIENIIKYLGEKRQTLMFSATWPKDVKALAEGIASKHIMAYIGRMGVSYCFDVRQSIVMCSDNEKLKKIFTFLNFLPSDDKVLIFVARINTANFLFSKLLNHFEVESIHGDKVQNDRENSLERFKAGKANIMVATDVVARGLDVDDILYVFNYDFPNNINDYVHRIGRTGRAGRTGYSFSFFGKEDYSRTYELVNVLQATNQEIPEAILNIARGMKNNRGPSSRYR